MEWSSSPCSSCRRSPCCTHLPLYRFTIRNRAEAEYARTLLCCGEIVLGLHPDGRWMAYYRSACRYLDRESSRCLIHGDPIRPRICVSYNPVNCWYRKAFELTDYADFLEFDGRRFEKLMEMLTFTDGGEIDSVPDWDDLRHALPVIEDSPAGPADFPANGNLALFPMREPETENDIDILSFRLGFCGVTSVLCERSWSLSVVVSRKAGLGMRITPPGMSGFPLQIDTVHYALENLQRDRAGFVFDTGGKITAWPVRFGRPLPGNAPRYPDTA